MIKIMAKYFLIGLLILIIPLMILEKLITRNTEKSNKEEVNIEEKIVAQNDQVEEYIPYYARSGNVEDRNFVLDLLYEYIFAVNDRDYEYAYDMLLPEYKESRYKTLQEFIDFCNNRYPTNISATVEKINKSTTGGYFAYITFFNEQIDDNAVSEEDMIRYKDYLAITGIDGNYFIAFDGYIKARKLNGLWENEKIRIRFIRDNIFFDSNEYIVEVTNLTDQSFNFWKVTTTAIMTDKDNSKYWINNKDETIDYDLAPQETKTFVFKFNHSIKNAQSVTIPFNKDFIEKAVEIPLNM